MSVDMKVKAIYDSEIGNITRSEKNWKDVLKVAGQLYRYEFDNIVMVTAQRSPERSTLMADYDTWKKVGRYVKRGAKGCAIFPSRALNPRMRYIFDIRTSPSRVGALGNAAMKRADFKRTGHPIYSWMVWGKRADELLQMDQPNAFGPGSVFDFLDINHAKQLTLGNTSSDSTTQMHHVEAACKVPYRFDKPFTGEYTDYSGNTCLKTYSMHVRPLNLKVTNTEVDRDERGKELEKRGIMKVKHLDEMTLVSTILLHELTEFLTEDMYQNEGKFTVSINDLPGYVAAGIKPEELKFYAE